MKQKLFKCLTSNTMSSVMSSVMSRVSNDCRMTLDRVSTLLLLLFALSFGFSSQAWAGTKRIYCKMTQSWWTTDNAAVGVHYWGGSSSTTWPGKRMTSAGSSIWFYDIPDNSTGFQFVRVNNSGTIADWGAKTKNLSFDGTNNFFTITNTTGCWSNNCSCDGEWSKYAPNGAILGSMNSWNPTTNQFSSGSVTITLAANTTYEFKVLYGSDYYSNNSAITSSVSNWGFATNTNDNCHLTTAVAGSYTFTWNSSTKKLSVTYPTITHPSSAYYYVKNTSNWSQVNAHLFTSSGIDTWPGFLPSSTTIGDETYYYFAAGAETTVIFSDNGNTQTSNITLSDNKGKYYDINAKSWKSFSWSVTLNTNGGTINSGNVTSYTYGTGATLPTSSNISKTGYTFAGWYNNSGLTGSAVTAISTTDVGAKEYWAKWTANTNTPYTVKHYQQNIADDDYTLVDTDNLTGTTDASVTPAVKNYTGFTAPSTQTKTIAADGSLVVTYNYTRNSHTLTWDANGGTIDGKATKKETLKYGAAITVPQTSSLSYSGHNFTGWNTTPASTMPDDDVTYTAQWEVAATATVTYDGNGNTGGTVPTDATTYAPGATVTVLTGTPEKTGYNFKGWKNSDGGAILSAGNQFIISSSVTLTAQWQVVTYTITYNGLEGGTHTNPANYTIETATITLTNASRDNYTFDGWYDAETGGNKVTQIALGSTGNKTLWARWSETLHSVNIVSGTGIESVSPAGETNVGNVTPVQISATVKAGYTWKNWTTDNSSNVTITDANANPTTIKATGSTNVTANATENKTAVTVSSNNSTWGTVSPTSANVGVSTSRQVTATPKAGYKFVSWTLDGGARLASGVLTNAQITIKGDGSSATGTAVATFAEDLSSNWYVEGDAALFKEGWNANENTMMKRTAPNAKSLTWTLTVADGDKTNSAGFKIYQKVNESNANWWGYGGGDAYWDIHSTAQNGLHHNNNANNIYFHPTVAGDYTFAINDITADFPTLTVTYPSVNELHHNFTGSWTHTAGTLKNGVLTVDYAITQAMVDSKLDLEFEMIYEGVYYGPSTDKAQMTATNHTDWKLEALGHGYHVVLKPSIAGTYTFVFDSKAADKNFNVTYPVPVTPASITVTKERYYGEDKINTFIATDPYTVYTDEKIKLTIDEVAAPTGCTTYYQFGENEASTERTYTISNITTTASSIEAKVFFRPNSGGKDGDATTETINYQGELTPALHLTTSWSEAQEGGDEVPENVTIYYSTTNYNGPATVTRSKDGAAPVTFMNIESGEQAQATYNLPDQNVQRQTFVATATTNGRTFTATKAVSIYRLVEIVITDEDHLMDHYYMWENGTNPLHEETAWPGKNFFSTLGDAHIFYVKYPSYTHFVLNNGNQEGAIQTVNIELPDQSACYKIGTQVTEDENPDKGKYQVETAECPNKLYVGDIDDVSAVQGEGVIVSPQVDIDPLLNENDLTISFNYGSTQGITCDQRGRSFMVTATAGTGTYEIQVIYSIPGAESVTKDVTINVTSAIMIQAKYGNLAWSDHNEIYIHYWGTDINATQKMTWKDYVNYEDRVYARIPLGNDNKINFQIYAWNMDEAWHVTKDVIDVTTSGCYAITPDDCEGCKRKINRDDDNCWTAYYVEIDMNNGTVYRSNTVEDLTNTVSFFAPGSSESQAKAGAVRIICNGSQKTVVNAATFTKSGIYTAKITANGEGLSDVAPYTGDFYIRTDGVAGGWNDYVRDDHKFTYFTPYKNALYDYYWVQNIKTANEGDKLNIKACIGNGINENLANMIEVSNYTDGYGNIIPDAGTGVNLRFGYNPETNYFERSILRGSTAGSNDFLNLVGNNVFNDKSCDNELNEANYSANAVWSKFSDISNWVYEKNVYVKIEGAQQSAQALLKSKANGTTIYQLGYEFDNFGRQTSTPAQRYILSTGTTNGTYNIRVIYDFKTNRIVSAWSPISDLDIEKDLTINADVLFVRHEEEDVAQVNLKNNAAKVSSLNDAYFVLEIDGSTTEKKTGESMYWFSVPFDCEISSIFGVEGYVTLNGNGSPTAGTWGIQTYDGKTRAEKGWYKEDTQTFWRWMDKSEKLLKGNGYLLVFDRADANDKGLWKAISREEPCEGTGDGCVDGKKTITTTVLRLYFPSKVSGWEMTRSAADKWVDYEDWTCQKKDRKAQDSNWRLLGTDSYSNIRIDAAAQFDRTEKDSVLDKAPNFVYEYHAEKEAYKRYKAVTSIGYNFKSFNCYMVQFSGSINWNQYTQSIPDPMAARRIVSENEITNAQMTLSLKKGDATEDNTYIYMDARATTDFDNQMDLTKIIDTRANQVYSVVNGVEYAGNTLPVESQTIPLTVNINASGTYTFSMPDGTSGVSATLIDAQDGSRTDLSMWDYTVDLNKGTFAGRFFIEIDIRKTPTQIDVTNPDMLDENGNPIKTVKFLHEDQLYIQRGQHIYDATGKVVK